MAPEPMTLTDQQHDEIISNASKAASRYRRKCWWADPEEMVQEAVAAQLKAAPNWDHLCGVPFGAYLWRVAVLSIRNWLWRSSSPVSSSHRPERMRGLHHLSLMVFTPDGDSYERPELRISTTPETNARISERTRKVQTRLVELLGADGAKLAIGILSKEYTPGDLAYENDIAPALVYRMMREIRARLHDKELYDLWAE